MHAILVHSEELVQTDDPTQGRRAESNSEGVGFRHLQIAGGEISQSTTVRGESAMLLLPAADARDAAAACCPLGLQTLIAAATPSSTYPPGRGNVATRTMAASPRAVRCLAAAAGGGGGAGADDCDGKEGDGDGCWVSYGWRRLPRRLPPPIPSLRPLARERTADGRLVISREEAAHRVGARKVKDRRLVLELVDDGGGAAPPAHHQWRWLHPLAAGQEAASNKPPSVPAEEDAARAASPVPAGACFEGAIRAASLRGTMRMSLPRMVH